MGRRIGWRGFCAWGIGILKVVEGVGGHGEDMGDLVDGNVDVLGEGGGMGGAGGVEGDLGEVGVHDTGGVAVELVEVAGDRRYQ